MLIAVVILFFLSLFLVLVVNKLQSSRPDWLPAKLKTWNWLPVWLRSLQPYDDVIDKILNFCRTKVLRRKDDGDSDEEDLDKEDEDGESYFYRQFDSIRLIKNVERVSLIFVATGDQQRASTEPSMGGNTQKV